MPGERDEDRKRVEPENGGTETANGAGSAWYRSVAGIAIVLADVLLTVVLVLWTIVRFDPSLVDPSAGALGGIPLYVYVFGALGALGFVFTALVEDFHSSTFELVRYNLRLPAALPLGVGVFLFSGIILGEASPEAPLVLGLVFLSGLYVNLAYKRLGALARRLLPDSGEGTD